MPCESPGKFRLYFRATVDIRRTTMGSKKSWRWQAALVAMIGACAACDARGQARSNVNQSHACCAVKSSGKPDAYPGAAAAARFAGRVDTLLAAAPSNKGEWGLLIVDGQTGEILFEKNA